MAVHKNALRTPQRVDRFLTRACDALRSDVATPSSPATTATITKQRPPSVSRATNLLFTAETCFRGLANVALDLFGITLERSAGALEPGAVLSVRLMREGRCEGVLHLDLFARPGKPIASTLYQLRTSVSRPPLPLPTVALEDDPRLPEAILATSYGSPRFLGFSGWETLMHEFGHALHALLSRTQFQHLSGTRGEADVAEFPSLLFQRLARDPRVVERALGSKLDSADVDALEVRGESSAVTSHVHSEGDVRFDLFVAVFDQLLFGDKMQDKSVSDVWRAAHERVGVDPARWFPPPSPTPSPPASAVRRAAMFGTSPSAGLRSNATPPAPPPWIGLLNHLATHAGTYYAYVLGEALARDVYEARFRADPLARTAGEALERELFRFGGSREPGETHAALCGRSVAAPLASSSSSSSPAEPPLLESLVGFDAFSPRPSK